MSAEQGDEWTPYHEFRKRTDPPPWGQGLDAEEPPMAEQGDVEVIRPWLEHVRDSGYPAQGDIALFALDRLAAALERAERERDEAWEFEHKMMERATEAEEKLEDVEARVEKAERERDWFRAGNQKLLDGQIRLAKRAEKAERALAENEQAWEDMRAYNIRLEERAREAERALGEMREALREIDEMESNAGTYDVVWDGVRQWVPKFKVIARAALRPSEDTSDES